MTNTPYSFHRIFLSADLCSCFPVTSNSTITTRQKTGMPPEFCEYGPDYESHCLPWLKKNHPALFKELAATVSTSDVKDAQEDDDAPERPSDPWTTEERLTAFYEKHEPSKVDNVPQLLEKYAGKEDKLFVALVKKYGPEPEDPYYAGDSSDEDDDDGSDLEEGMEGLAVSGSNQKRRGAKAKKSKAVETKVLIQKLKRQRKKATTVISGMETVPGIKLKDVSKAFSKRFAGSSSVKDGAKPGSKEIIIQGDHMEDVADMIVKQFKVPKDAVFLDMEGEIMSYA